MAFIIKWCALIGMATVVAVLTIVHPTILAKNQFLDSFVSHEILALLIIILTITLASVGNIHLTISRLTARFNNKSEGELAATSARAELNSSAWSLLWSFVVCVSILLIKGSFTKIDHIVSIANGFALIILAFNMMVLHDIYTTIFDLVKQDTDTTEHSDKSRGPN